MGCILIRKGEWGQSLYWEGNSDDGPRYRIMYEEVMKTIVQHYPELNPEELKFVFDYWAEAKKIQDDE